MGILNNFREHDFPAQVDLLTRIQREKLAEAIPELFDLYVKPLKDAMVDHLVAITLLGLMADEEPQTLKRLINGNIREKMLCVIIAGNNRFRSVVPILENMIGKEEFQELQAECFFALGKIKSPQSLRLFRRHIHHPDEVTASLAIQMIGKYRDEASIENLLAFLEDTEKIREYETCSLKTGMAVEALAAMKSRKALKGLVAHIHHRNATIRRIIHDALVRTGPNAVPMLADVFDTGRAEEKVLAANILGLIGGKPAGEIMIRALDEGGANHPNVRFAIYEAFGRIPFLKGLTCLTDALQEEDDLILMAVLTSLEAQISTGVVASLRAILARADLHGDKLIRTLVAVKAVRLYEHLYSDPVIAGRMTAQILETNDPAVRAAFRKILSAMPGERAASDLRMISSLCASPDERKVLVIDDSKAMLSFYQSVVLDMGLNILTAANGREALNLMEEEKSFALIITDMNMPVMDGLELTRKIREQANRSVVPILMATTESEQSQRDMAHSAGVSAFITKPFTAAVLKEKVTGLLCN